MLWIKAFHIIFMVTWFAGLFYLPRLFVYHALAEDEISKQRFRVMERKLYFGIMTPGAILTLVSGFWLMFGFGFTGKWLMWKLLLVLLLVIYHIWCIFPLRAFAEDRNTHGHRFYRIINELPVLGLVGIVLLVVLKPV